MKRTLLPFLGVPLLVAQLGGQTFRTGVDMVTIDVSAFDSTGKPVHDLTKSDFSVSLDGKVVPIQSVEFENFGSNRRTSGLALGLFGSAQADNNAGRTILIAVDDISATPTEGRQLVASLTREIDLFGQNDLVGLVTTSGLGPAIGPTTDRGGLRLALKSKLLFGRRTEGPVLVTFKEALEINGEVRGAAAVVTRRECAISPAGCGGVSHAARAALAEGKRIEEQQLRALTDLARSMGRMPEPRILILLTSGIPFGMDGRPLKEMAEVSAAFAAAQVRLYSLTEVPDLVGASTTGDRAKAVLGNSDYMYAGTQTVASAVGGRSMKVIGQGDRFFERIERETSLYYRLYVEMPTQTRRDHPLAVRVRSTRSNVDVVSAANVIIPSGPLKAEPIVERLKRQLARGGPAFGVPLSVGTITRLASGTSQQIGFELMIPGHVPGPITVLFALIDARGRVVASGQRSLAAASGEYRFASGLTTEAGEFQLRIAAADANGSIGASDRRAATGPLAVGGLRTSGLFTTWQDQDGTSHLMAAGSLPAAAKVLQPTLEFYPPRGTFRDVSVDFSVREDETGTEVYREARPVTPAGDRYVSQGNWAAGSAAAGNYTIVAQVLEGTREVGRFEQPLLIQRK